MEKTGQVRPGKTPSTVSGLPSTQIVQGEPVRPGEAPVDPGPRKLASTLEPSEDKEHEHE